MGRRIQSSITKQGQATATVQYLYEGAQALGEIRDGRLSHRLLTGLSLDETIARIAITTAGAKDQAASRIFLTDALNSVIAQMSDSDDSTLQTSYAYSPYGASTTVGTDPANNPIQYTSRENDGTGHYYYRARYYDPVLGRFVSEGPIGLAGGWNAYGYVEGDPVSLVDPEGLQSARVNNSGLYYPKGSVPEPVNPLAKPEQASLGMARRELAGLFNPPVHALGEEYFVCVMWNCPSSPNACSPGDMKKPTDFLPTANSPKGAPSGCKCILQLPAPDKYDPPQSNGQAKKLWNNRKKVMKTLGQMSR
jgi:RHS repeat-associated protein